MSGIGTAGQIEVPAEKERDVVLTSESIPAQRVPRGTVPLDQVAPSLTNPRTTFDPDALDELAASIRTHGLIEPIVVRPNGAGWMLVAGERRWRAAALAGLQEIPAIIREDLDDAAAMKIQIVENLQRQDLDPIEEASGYRMLAEQLSMTQEAIAAAVGRSRASIGHALRLLELPADVQQRIQAGELSVAHGKALVQFASWPKLCATIARVAIDEGFPSKRIEKGIGSGGLPGHTLTRKGGLTHVDLPEGCTVDDLRAAGVTVWGSGHYDTYTPDKAAYERARDAIVTKRQAEHQRQMQTLRDKAKATDKPVIKLGKLGYGDYEDLRYGPRPTGCGPDCPCLAQALGRNGGEIVPICTDPTRFKRLKRADQSADSKQRKEQVRQTADALDAILTVVPALDSRGLAIVVADRLWQLPKAISKRLVLEFAGDVLDPSVFDGYDGRRDTYPKLATLPAETLIRMLVHGTLLDEIGRYQQYGSLSKELAWYMEGAGVAILPTDPAELTRRIAEARAAIDDIKVQNQPTVCARWQATLEQLEARLAAAQKSKPVRTNPTVCQGCGHVKGKCTCSIADTTKIAGEEAPRQNVEPEHLATAAPAHVAASKAAIAAARTEAVG